MLRLIDSQTSPFLRKTEYEIEQEVFAKMKEDHRICMASLRGRRWFLPWRR